MLLRRYIAAVIGLMSTPQSSQLTLLTVFDALSSFLSKRCSPDGSSQARDLSAGHDQKCELTVNVSMQLAMCHLEPVSPSANMTVHHTKLASVCLLALCLLSGVWYSSTTVCNPGSSPKHQNLVCIRSPVLAQSYKGFASTARDLQLLGPQSHRHT